MILTILYCLSWIVVIVLFVSQNLNKLNCILDFSFFFTAGFIYYLLIPFGLTCVWRGGLINNYFGMVGLFLYGVTDAQKIIALISIDLLYMSMIGFSGIHMNTVPKRSWIKQINDFSLWVTLVFSGILFLFALYLGRLLIGHGYSGEYQSSIRGPFTFAAHIASLSLLIYMERKESYSKVALCMLCIIQALVISTGTRMECITMMITVFLAILNLKRKKNVAIFKMILVVILAASFMTYVGIVRSGYAITKGIAVSVLMGEAIATDYSFFSSLGMNVKMPLLSNPLKLSVLLVNLIPTMLYPNKWEVYHNLIYNGSVKFANPAGAMSLHTSLMIFFGILGIPVFCLLLSIMLKFIRNMSEFVYYDAIGACTFLLFRNGFETTLIKNLFECCVLFPFFVICFNLLVVKAKTRLFFDAH